MSVRPPQHGRRWAGGFGFTLVEVVVALALGVTLLVAVQALVVTSFRTSVEIQSRSAAQAARELPFDLLGPDLASLPAGGGFTLGYGGLTFTTLDSLHSQRLAARHAVVVRYRGEQAAGRVRLVRQEREVEDQRFSDSGVVLTQDATAIHLEILDGRSWHDRWPLRTARTPAALRLTIEGPEGESLVHVFPLQPMRWRRHDG